VTFVAVAPVAFNVLEFQEELTDRKFLRPYLNDKIVVDVLERIKDRADAGMSKYGVPMTREDVDTIGWLRHAQEEALDLAIYLERCIRDYEKIHKL